MLEKIQGYKTLAFGSIVAVLGIAVAAGLMSVELQAFVLENMETVWGSSLALIGIVINGLRFVTKTPVLEAE